MTIKGMAPGRKHHNKVDRKMFAIIVLCSALVLAPSTSALELPPEMKELMDNLHAACLEETGVAESLVDQGRTGNFPEDRNFKCYVKCIMQQLQAMTDEGDLDMELIEGSIPEEFKKHGALDTIKKCKDQRGADPCETALLLVKCFHSDNPTLSSLFE